MSRFITPPIENFPRFYQELLEGVLSYERLGNRLIALAERARAVRQWSSLSELAAMLINYPLKDYQVIGQYYYGLGLCQNGLGELDKARVTLESVACNARPEYRAEAMLSLSAISWVNNKPEETFKYCLEAGKLGKLNTALQGLRGVAVLKARVGDHKSALADLENLRSLMRHAPLHIYFDYLNSLAVELGEAGRKDEARHIIRRVLASPYAWAYPEWQQTVEDLRPASRSFIVPNPPPLRIGNLLRMPATERTEPVKQDRPAPIVSLQQWKMKMAKREEYEKHAKDKPKTTSERVMYIMDRITTELTNEELDKVIEAIDKVHARKNKK
jgi:tetratricopeptide (TPR) repeat protein